MDSIPTVKWPKDLQVVAFTSSHIDITKELIEVEARKQSKEEALSKIVDVKFIDFRWFFNSRRNFIYFVKMLDQVPDTFYSSWLMVVLLDKFWPKLRTQILWK